MAGYRSNITAIKRAMRPATRAVSMGSILAFDVSHEIVEYFCPVGFGVQALCPIQDPSPGHQDPMLPKYFRQAVIGDRTVSRESVAANGE